MQQIMKYKILQTKADYVFRDYKCAKNNGFSLDDYKVVWEDEINVGSESDKVAVAELLFMLFNSSERPEGFTGRSMSVSDVVIIDTDVYYCDEIGFKKLA